MITKHTVIPRARVVKLGQAERGPEGVEIAETERGEKDGGGASSLPGCQEARPGKGNASMSWTFLVFPIGIHHPKLVFPRAEYDLLTVRRAGGLISVSSLRVPPIWANFKRR